MKKTLCFIGILSFLLSQLSQTTLAQKEVVITYPNHKLGPFSASHRFRELTSRGGDSCICHHHFVPNKNKIKAYTQEGKVITLFKSDTIKFYTPTYIGEYDGKKGEWVPILGIQGPHWRSHPDYVFLNDLTDIEKEVKAADAAEDKLLEEARQKKKAEQLEEFFRLLPYVLAFLGIAILIYGLATMCPKCGAWYKRKHERTEYMGSSTYSGTRSVRKEVYGTENGGYVYVNEPYTQTTLHYRKHYRCKKCGYRWTKD